MDARIPFRGQSLCLAAVFLVCAISPAFAASARTQNFVVSAPTQELANEIAKAAEDFRRDLAVDWLGSELPNWEQPCPITAQVDQRLGAGGETSFMFGGGRPYGWTMRIQGSRERVLDSVLPHEVTHTIFATHFGRPLPRWADEGACTTVEHASERGKQEKLLYQFLTTNRGIAFNKMFAMKEYPRDILPLYSQGYALARFLIALEGRRKFVDYVGAGMDSNNWTAATKEFYGFHSLSDLQLSWLEWIRKGTPIIKDANDVKYVSTEASRNGRSLAEVLGKVTASATAVALLNNPPPKPLAEEPRGKSQNTVAMPAEGEPVRPARQNDLMLAPKNVLPGKVTPVSATAEPRPSGDGWYARRRDEARSRGIEHVAALPEEYRDDDRGGITSRSRPQPPEQVKQTILQWRKEDRMLAPLER